MAPDFTGLFVAAIVAIVLAFGIGGALALVGAHFGLPGVLVGLGLIGAAAFALYRLVTYTEPVD